MFHQTREEGAAPWGDAGIFGAGVFVSLWVVLFFGFSAYEMRKGFQTVDQEKEPRGKGVGATNREATPLRVT